MKMRNIHFNRFLEVTMDEYIEVNERKCQRCKKSFTPMRKWQKFCCLKCKDLYWEELRKEALQIVRSRHEQ